MPYAPGDWVELVRAVNGAPVGQRGKVTSTGFLGELDIQLSTGARLVGVDASVVKHAAPDSPLDSTGCAVTGLVGVASIVTAFMAAWSRVRCGG